MAIGFAGSRSLDGRRRRRLVSESDDGIHELDLPDEPQTLEAAVDDECPEPQPRTEVLFPVRQLVSPKIWKHWAVGFLGVVVVACLIGGAYQSALLADSMSPGLLHLFALPSLRAATFFSSTLLLLAGLLSLLIWWARSRSRHDFSGSYRIWAWAAGVWTLLAAAVAVDAPQAVEQTVGWYFKSDVGYLANLCWLVPGAAIGASLVAVLNRELRGCRSSLAMMWLAMLTYLTAAALRLGLPLAETQIGNDLACAGATMTGHLALFLCILHHARHVVHVSLDPPSSRRVAARSNRFARLKRGLESLVPNRGRRREAVPPPEQSTPETVHVAPPVAGDASVDCDSTDADFENVEQQATELINDVHEEAAIDEPPLAPAASAHAPQRNAIPETESTDEAQPAVARKSQMPMRSESDRSDAEFESNDRIDPNQLKGLSKRERRKLRKEWREQQKATGR